MKYYEYKIISFTGAFAIVKTDELSDAITSMSVLGYELYNISASSDTFVYLFRKEKTNE